MKRYALGGLVLLLLLGPSSGTAQEPPGTAQEPQAPPPATTEAAEEAVLPACADCHDQAKAFLTNPHARGGVTNGVVSTNAPASKSSRGVPSAMSLSVPANDLMVSHLRWDR